MTFRMLQHAFSKVFFKDDSNIITEPGKGNRVFIISKLDYLQKMKAIMHF